MVYETFGKRPHILLRTDTHTRLRNIKDIRDTDVGLIHHDTSRSFALCLPDQEFRQCLSRADRTAVSYQPLSTSAHRWSTYLRQNLPCNSANISSRSGDWRYISKIENLMLAFIILLVQRWAFVYSFRSDLTPMILSFYTYQVWSSKYQAQTSLVHENKSQSVSQSKLLAISLASVALISFGRYRHLVCHTNQSWSLLAFGIRKILSEAQYQFLILPTSWSLRCTDVSTFPPYSYEASIQQTPDWQTAA